MWAKRSGITVIGLLAVGMLLPMRPAEANHLGSTTVYENWSAPKIPGDRWRGSESFGGQESKRALVLRPDGKLELRMRLRREGDTDTNTDVRTTANRMNLPRGFLPFTNPASLDGIEAKFNVLKVKLTGCPANPEPSAARPARILLAKVNDGTPPEFPGDLTGDIIAGIQAVRTTNDAPGGLRVEAFIDRCTDSACATTENLTASSDFPGVFVGVPFKLWVIWDATNHSFRFGVNSVQNERVLTYSAAFTTPAAAPFANLAIANSTANCTAGPTLADVTTAVRKVWIYPAP